jgi:hypothetical protein
MCGFGRKPRGDRLENPGVHGRILKWILKRQDGRAYTEFICLRIGITGEVHSKLD